MARKYLLEEEIDLILEGDVSGEDDSEDELDFDDILKQVQNQVECFGEADQFESEIEYAVSLDDLPAEITLNTYIREYAQLGGTKFMCLEGGCGVCIVTITKRHPITQKYLSWAANSCLTLLSICDGWHITTIEGLGNKRVGYNLIQQRLADLNGSQCGYCSPGMVMNMYSNLKARGGKMTQQEIENSFGGNLCRCTGYRPILDAMKSFACDTDFEYVDLCTDIEDMWKPCHSAEKKCQRMCRKSVGPSTSFDGRLWYFPKTLQEVFQIFYQINDKSYILVSGNTGHGVYRRDPHIDVFIDLNYTTELHTKLIGTHQLELGSNISLTEMIDILTYVSAHDGFEYCKKLVKHISLIANIPVRNMGTLAGNLSLKHDHHEFASDIFLLLTAIGATIYIAHSPDYEVSLTLPDYLKYDMKKKVITKLVLPYINRTSHIFKSYKVAPTAQNAHAYVNGAFFLERSNALVTKARICFGGINAEFIEASATEHFLTGRLLNDEKTITQTFEILASEVKPDWILPDSSSEFRLKLACGLFYKFILKVCPPNCVKPQYQSGASRLKRPLSSGSQNFNTKEDKWPLTKPIAKIDSLSQCSGEAFYINDLPHMPGQLWGAFVVATAVKGVILSVDASDVLRFPGVVAFYSAKDIPGKNSFVTIGLFGIVEDEEIFCTNVVKYHSQPIGVIVAESLDLAKFAATKVTVKYEYRNEVVHPTVQDIVGKLPLSKPQNGFESNVEQESSQYRVVGHFEMGGQYHFSMEPQTTICVPNEDSLKIYSSTHYIDLVQSAVAQALSMKESNLNFELRRVGGSFGSKLSRCSLVATACALASVKLNRPIRFVMSLESNMACIGKRNACVCDYSAEIKSSGVVTNLSIHFLEDLGCSLNESPIDLFTVSFVTNCYLNNGWNIKGEPALTDAPSHTWCRAPGTLEGIAMIENIMEHIARVVNKDPIDVRIANLPKNSKMRELLPQFLESTEYRKRKVDIDSFNHNNRWRKRGIAISLMRYPIKYFGSFPATVIIYHVDGSVGISHGGVEIGQGINTKVLQVAASTLGLPLEMITIKPTNNINGANSLATAGSIGSESICFAVRHACLTLLERIQPIKQTMLNATWVEVIQKCHENHVHLIANHLYKQGDLQEYEVWGIAASEVEVDIPTGVFQLVRVDLLQDTGESLSPMIDIGQIEGAFVMGLGYWHTELLVYDRQSGELLTNRTWNYKVPGTKDIPIDFRITLLQNSPNSGGFLRSKTSGELGICLSVSSVFALRHAIDSARAQAGTNGWYHLGAPTTPETILLAAGHGTADFKLK